MKKIITSALVVVVATLVISAGFALAVTFKDVTPVKTVSVETLNAKGVVSIVEQTEEVPDLDKKIEKTWTEAREETFEVRDKLRNITDQITRINNSIIRVNEDIDELTAVKAELGLTFDIPAKKSLNDVK